MRRSVLRGGEGGLSPIFRRAWIERVARLSTPFPERQGRATLPLAPQPSGLRGPSEGAAVGLFVGLAAFDPYDELRNVPRNLATRAVESRVQQCLFRWGSARSADRIFDNPALRDFVLRGPLRANAMSENWRL
jgi:hypothetical protein